MTVEMNEEKLKHLKLIAVTAEITVPDLMVDSTKQRIESLQKSIEVETRGYTNDEIVAALVGMSGLIVADKIVAYSLMMLKEHSEG